MTHQSNPTLVMKTQYLLLIVLLGLFPAYGQVTFSKQQVLEDLDFMDESLKKTHYDLYAYTTQNAFEENFENIKASITSDSLSYLEATSLFQSVISKVNNGHTEIAFPGSAYIDYAYKGGTIFPLELAFEEGKALVRKNWSNNDSIRIGAEILSINGQPIEEILEKIYPFISAERHYFKLAKIELISFPRLYWQAYGELQNFDILLNIDHVKASYSIEAIDLIEGFEMKRNEVFYSGREFKFFENTAYLRPGNFSGDEQKYNSFIDSAFTTINGKNVPNLIIDLRNNLGGDNSFSDYLVSYIADEPFNWCSQLSIKTSAILKAHVREKYDTTDFYWSSILAHENGSKFQYPYDKYLPQPIEKRYSGKIFVLVNRQSHSQSAVTASQIQDYNFATIVGEETGDFPSLYASQYSFPLPNTGIEVKVSKGQIVRVNGSRKPEGVIPDIFIKDHLLDENDEILNGLLKRLNEN